jgi:hypothetical protein
VEVGVFEAGNGNLQKEYIHGWQQLHVPQVTEFFVLLFMLAVTDTETQGLTLVD